MGGGIQILRSSTLEEVAHSQSLRTHVGWLEVRNSAEPFSGALQPVTLMSYTIEGYVC